MLGVTEACFAVQLLGPLYCFVMIIIFRFEVVFLCLLPFFRFFLFIILFFVLFYVFEL